MSRLEDIFRNEAEIQIAMRCHDYEVEVEYKPFTVRIPVHTLAALDNLAKCLRKTRNEVASDLITVGLEDAVCGYSSVFPDPQKEYEDIMNGLSQEIEWTTPPKAEDLK